MNTEIIPIQSSTEPSPEDPSRRAASNKADFKRFVVGAAAVLTIGAFGYFEHDISKLYEETKAKVFGQPDKATPGKAQVYSNPPALKKK